MYVVDVEAKRRHQQAIDLAQEALKSCQEEIDQLTEQESQINAEYRASREQYVRICASMGDMRLSLFRTSPVLGARGLASFRRNTAETWPR